MLTIDDIVNDILNKRAGTDPASREQLNNSITKNSITQATNPADDSTRDCAGGTKTSSSFCPAGQEKDAGVMEIDNNAAGSVPALCDAIIGVEVQRKQLSDTSRLTIHTTVQTNHFEKPLKYTVYLLPRDRGREFIQITDLDKDLYKQSKVYKHWMIGHLTETSTKRLINDITATYDPHTEILTFWFVDYSQCIQIPTNNKPVTPKQQQNGYISAGTWGQPVNLPKTKGISFLQARSFAGGRNEFE